MPASGDSSSPTSGTSPPPTSNPPPSNPPPAPSPLAITTTSLPAGTLNNAYATTLAASGGTPPYHWSLTGGSLPSGLSLDASTGTIAGTPASAANKVVLTFKVADSATSAQTASASFSLTVNPGTISISISPARAGLAAGQQLHLTATTDDPSGVTWSSSPAGGAFSSATTASGTPVTFTAPTTAGRYSITASSVADPTQSASMQVGVTDLAGVFTYHNDLSRDGANEQEYALTPGDVNSSSFGKLFSCPVDGAIQAQPLWVANLRVGGTTRNVVLVATQHDSLYELDADASPCQQLWHVSLIDASHGGTGGETTVPAGSSGNLVGQGDGDMAPEVGVTGTPVIDPATGTLYVVSKSMNAAGTSFFQRLHAIDLATGAEKPGSPVSISATFPGTGGGGSTVSFNARMENQRAGLALADGTVYVAWGSHEDAMPYYGWIMGYTYNGSSFTQTTVFNAAPNTGEGGIWMSGAAPAVDSQGRLYVMTGNAGFDATSSTAPNDDYGDSLLELSLGLKVLQYFTPSNQNSDRIYNNDFGSGGAAVLTDLPAGSPVTHLLIGGGKDGNLYVFNRDALGGYGDSNAWQELSVGTEGDLNADTPGVIFTVGAIWADTYYLAGARGPLKAYRLDPSTAKLSLAGTATSPSGGYGYPGSTPSISASGSADGVVWVLDDSQYCTPASPGCGPAVLHAYDASNVSKELWNSAGSSSDRAGNAVKFALPTIANGKVYVGTRGNNTGGVYGSTSISGELDVYGLKP
ncbi:MAG TPA: Ig domain-containing protein [Steroidobacteraceae bacterium]|nr:Ig domain-containing protein [Steroidobacteraceae bacterium]